MTKQQLYKIYLDMRHLFFQGLFFLLPIALTFSLFHICLNLIMSWLEPLRKLHLPFLEMIPYYEIIVVCIFILLVGICLKAFVLKPMIKVAEDIFAKIPLLSTVYFGIKQLIEAFSAHNHTTFTDVVYVQYPRIGMYSIGFLTSQVAPEIAPDQEKKYYNIYLPTTPNPTHGYFIILSQDQFHHANLTRQEAITMIISGGIVQPEQYKK
ncbi:MAG: DUF502 domain-containing protein [Candidatus Chromulinivorax sp.]